MGNLAFDGVSSLKALNSWIGVIDNNIVNAKRIGYKSTRLSFQENNSVTIGKTPDYFGKSIVIPSASLLLANTQILDYEQGMLTKTDNISDFAIEGRGYFVVEDYKGDRYATRDGEFRFDNDGYLVNANGLKVLSAGQDYIRVPVNETFFTDDKGVTLVDNSLYGNRQLMMINLPQSGSLFYSQYGFTTFEIGNFLPLDFNNDFNKTMDGINPYLVDSTFQQSFNHDKSLGKVDIDLRSNVSALVTAHTFTEFRNDFNFTLNDANLITNMNDPDPSLHIFPTPASGGPAIPAAADFNSIGFNFGQRLQTDSLVESGYAAGIVNDAGTHKLRFYEGGSLTPNVLASVNLPANLVQGTEYKISLVSAYEGITVTLSDAATNNPIVSLNIGLDKAIYSDKYMSLGALNGTSASTGGLVSVRSLHVKEINKKQYYDYLILGGTADSLDARIHQQHLEESTSTLADALPELSNAQKLFSSVSKVIAVSNTMTDDMNSLIR